MMHDLDAAFGPGYDRKTLDIVTDPEGPGHANAPWATLLIRKLLENSEYRNNFINRFADFLNTIFTTDYMTEKLDEIVTLLEPEMPYEIERWGSYDDPWAGWIKMDSIKDWYANVEVVRKFIRNRPAIMKQHIINKFGLSGALLVELNVNDPGKGSIRFSTLDTDANSWEGTYFKDVPILVKAVPKRGYRFAGWTGVPEKYVSTAVGDSFSVILSEKLTLTAQFVEIERSETIGSIVTNEINYRSADDFDPGDWVELHSTYTKPVDLSGWIFKDEDDAHEFVIPERTIIEPAGYLVLCENTATFHELFPDVGVYIGDLGFGLSGGGEFVRLYDTAGIVADTLRFEDDPPWPVDPKGGGKTLSLINPDFDNASHENWAPSLERGGTPGAPNDVMIRDTIVINEINYNSSADFDPGDWVELHSTYSETVDLSGWILKDEDDTHEFIIPYGTTIEPGGYVVLCENTEIFHGLFPDVNKYNGDLGFGFSGAGEIVRLFNADGAIVDSVAYDDDPPWPEEPKGSGPTLALTNPYVNNASYRYWEASYRKGGTPGETNDTFITVVEKSKKPRAFSLHQNYPNPFNPVTFIRNELPAPCRVEMVVYDILGRRVRVLENRYRTGSVHELIWDGRNDEGTLVGSGVYIYRLQAGDFSNYRKMVFMR